MIFFVIHGFYSEYTPYINAQIQVKLNDAISFAHSIFRTTQTILNISFYFQTALPFLS